MHAQIETQKRVSTIGRDSAVNHKQMHTKLMDQIEGAGNVGFDKAIKKISAFLQPPLNRYFIPRPPPPYKEPLDRDFSRRTGCRLSGIGQFIKLAQQREKRKEDYAESLKKQTEAYRPKENASFAKSDPFRTIFVGRLPYQATERALKKEFEIYGSIKSISIIQDTKRKRPRGYAFIEYEREKSVKEAYLDGDGRKIEQQRRCVVDVERGRTVKGWLPRRLGGGLGKTRVGPPEVCQKTSGRDPEIDTLKSSSASVSSSSSSSSRDRRRSRSRDKRRYSRSRSRSPGSRHHRHHHDPYHEPPPSSSYRDYDRPKSSRNYY